MRQMSSFEGSVIEQVGGIRRKPLPQFAVFSGARLKIISISKRHILCWHFLNS